MDTLPLNGNHANNYSMASSEYLSDCVQILDRSGGYRTHSNHKETTLEKKILKELTSNYVPSYLNNHERATTERNHNLMNKLVNGGDYLKVPCVDHNHKQCVKKKSQAKKVQNRLKLLAPASIFDIHMVHKDANFLIKD